VLELILAGGLWGRPFGLPPDVPKDRVTALRKAFGEMMNDPQFIAEAQKLDLDLDLMDGAQIDEVLAKSYGSSSEVIAAARRAIGGN
jgi:tripartite-type tricarboxylate transporter receptor subunit TctC